MPSLKNRPSGIRVDIMKGTRGNITLKRNSSAYAKYIQLRSDDKSVMDAILMLMQTHRNDLCVGGGTLAAIVKNTGYSADTILNSVVRLAEAGLVMRTSLPLELLVNPVLAIKGNEEAIWKYQHAIAYSFDTYKLSQYTWSFE